MDIGIIGNRGHLNYVFEGMKKLPQIRITAISTGTEEDDPTQLLTQCNEAGQSPTVYSDYQEMLDKANISLVCIAGPFELHTRMCLEAFARGMHVFCEKPVSIFQSELELLEAGFRARKSVQFSSMMGIRYHPEFYTAWELVRSGLIGQVRLLNAQKSYKLGERPAYYRQRQTYGGTIPWVGIHAIDWVHWFSQARFLSVRASQSNIGNHGNGSLEVSALCQFKLENEILASVSVDYLRPETADTHGDDRIRVVGTAGVIEVRAGKVFLINADQPGEREVPVACDRQVFCDFIEQIETGRPALLSPEDIFLITRASLLAQQSADEDRKVVINSENLADSHYVI